VNSRLAAVFDTAKAENRAALIGYLPAGFPDHASSIELFNAMTDAGVDAIEVGLPYSDPLMDGAAIQEAVSIALDAGTTTDVVLDIVEQISDHGATALVMSYWNPIERYGVQRFSERLASAQGVGVITPDLTPEEAGPWSAATDAFGIDRVFLVAPSSTQVRIDTVTAATTGFVYAASTMGVTGARGQVSSAAPELVARVREATQLPIAVGLGVSTGAQAKDVAHYADGVIVGSAFVNAILHASDHAAALRAVTQLAAELAAGVRGEA
jgi:tryptophan synthase alpha chain